MSRTSVSFVLSLCVPALISCAAGSAGGQSAARYDVQVDDADAGRYPAADAGYQRTAYLLPHLANENGLRLRLIVGKIEARSCNDPPYVGRLEERSASDSGARYFVLKITQSQRHIGMMPCPLNPPSFVQVSGNNLTVPYDSTKLLVVYAPADFSVKYEMLPAV